MASNGSKSKLPATRELDLRDPARYTASIEWLRENVVLANHVHARVLQLDVALPDGQVALFMNPANHYLMGFRGADKIYVLDDDTSDEFRKSLQSEFNDTEVEILKGLGADHGDRGLKTFSRTNSALKGRVFKRKDLNCSAILSGYSSTSRNLTYEKLRAPLSLLVCMISESARIPMMERDFTNMLYYGYDVWADDAIRSFDNAKYLIDLARKLFPEYPVHLAVEKLQKRAAEMESLVTKIESVQHYANRHALIAAMLKGSVPNDNLTASAVNRFRDMCNELKMSERKLSDPAVIAEMISSCKSEGAIRAAKQGVATPDLPRKA
jgi:hypothetical protein